MSCSPEILLFVEDCEAQEVEERRAKFITEEEEVYRRRASSPTTQDTLLIDEARDEVGSQRNDEISRRILEEESNGVSTQDENGTEYMDVPFQGDIPEGIVKWDGEYRGRASGDTYSETDVHFAQMNGDVLWTMYVDDREQWGHKEDIWFNKEIHKEGWTVRDENGERYLCAPGWSTPEDSLDHEKNYREEPYPEEVCVKALEIMRKATWLPNVSQPTRGGKYFLKGDFGDSGFISWTEGDTVCYVSALDGNILVRDGGKSAQYKGFSGAKKKQNRLLLGTALLDYFAPWR